MAPPKDVAAATPGAPLTVRDGTPDDEEWVLRVTRERLDSEWQAMSDRGLFLPTHFPVLVAERAGRRLGFLSWEVADDVAEAVVLACEERDAGAGRALMEALAALAARRGCTTLKVVTTAGNAAARGFYEHLGYEVAEIRAGARTPEGVHDEVEYRRAI